jgi:putative DNA primase/helicase
MSQGIDYEAGARYLIDEVPGQPARELIHWRGAFYRYERGAYRPVTDGVVEIDYTRWVARNPGARQDPGSGKISAVTNAFVKNSMLAIRAEAAAPDDLEPGEWIQKTPPDSVGPFLSTAGGIVDLGRLDGLDSGLIPSTPNYFTLSTLPVAPAAAADCPIWAKFLTGTFPDDDDAILLLQEIFGYMLWPDCRYEAFFVLFGDGNTGRSTVAETLQAMLGASNCSALSLERLGERFALPALIGKLANICFDAGEIEKGSEGILKALVSGEPVPVEPKHCPVATMRLMAKHLFVTNVLPRFHDTSAGLWRRLVLLPFERVCPIESRDPELKAKLRAELSGILRWALEGLARLCHQGGFTKFGPGQRLAETYRLESNPVGLFLAEEVVEARDDRTGRKALYSAYRRWAEANGHAALSSTKLYREVRAKFPQPPDPPREERGGDRAFVGFRLREPAGVLERIRDLSRPGRGGTEGR